MVEHPQLGPSLRVVALRGLGARSVRQGAGEARKAEDQKDGHGIEVVSDDFEFL